MRKLVFAAALLASTALASLPASAAVFVQSNLSGTGDNVIFNALSPNLAIGTFNGQHTGFVNFSCLGGCTAGTGFTAAANGNDIKIANTNNLRIQVFDAQGNLIGTTTEVFSLSGTGSVTALVSAVDANGNPETVQSFLLGAINNSQSGFTFGTRDGEVITSIVLLDQGGNITGFEHFRIEAAAIPQLVPIPLPAGLFVAGLVGIGMLKKRADKKRKAAELATA